MLPHACTVVAALVLGGAPAAPVTPAAPRPAAAQRPSAPAAPSRLLDPDRILPVVELAARPAAPGAVREPLAGPLAVRYVERSEGGAKDVTAAALASAGLPPAGLRALAVRNLKGLLDGVSLDGGDGVYLVQAGGEHEAALLLVDDLWSGPSIAAKVKGAPVVAVPARDVILVTGSEDQAGLEKVRAAAARVLREGTDTLSADLLVWRGGRFEAFEAP